MRLAYRAAVPADHDFIAATWSKCWDPPREVAFVTRSAWRTAVWSSVSLLLATPEIRVLVAVDADTTDGIADLFGWLAWKPHAAEMVVNGYTRRPTYRRAEGGPLPVVFCCYVKREMRRSGIARGLFSAARIDPRAPFVHACHTRFVDDITRAGKISATWCPNLGRLPERTHGQPRPESEDADAA